MYLRNRWYCAAVSDELGTAPLGRIFLDEPVVMYRKTDGGIVALEDRCCHRRAPLSKGKIEGANIRCGQKGWSARTAALPNGVLLTVTARTPEETQHIRGLGFIGILATGAHHQAHHLAIARGEMVHAH